MDALCSRPMSRQCMKTIGYGPVLVICAIEVWVYYAYVGRFCVGIFRQSGASWVALAVMLLMGFHVLFGLHLIAYYRTVFTHPGSTVEPRSSTRHRRHFRTPPSVSQHDGPPEGRVLLPPSDILMEERNTTSSSSSVRQPTTLAHVATGGGDDVEVGAVRPVTAKRDGQQRYCQKCRRTKPDRSHHCSVCQECVLKMDHHCPWINNCVGYHNQKFFFQFVAYGALLCVYVCLTVTPTYYALIGVDSRVQADMQWLLLSIVGIVFGLSLLGFAAMHGNFIMSNKTTIESWERHRYRTDDGHLVPSRGRDYVNVFDVGRKANWRQVMGAHWLQWFLPIDSCTGDGFTFPLNHEAYATVLGRGVERDDSNGVIVHNGINNTINDGPAVK